MSANFSAPTNQTEPHASTKKTLPRTVVALGWVSLLTDAASDMIHPLVPFAIRGTIWYQGESNAGNGPLYAVQLPLMIRDWRARWGKEFPFAWVQLPNFQKREAEPNASAAWARLREAQSKALAVPNTGMTVNLDIGDAVNLHPTNKLQVGHRLALWARAKVYGEKIVWSGPQYESHAVQGSEVVIQFQHAEGLKTSDGGAVVKGFAIADESKHWQWADARIEGRKAFSGEAELCRVRNGG